MDVHRAVVDFTPPPGSGRVLSLLLGEFIEVLEPETTRQHREWWGVRRLYDEELGYVPAKYLEFHEHAKAANLPEDYKEQRQNRLRLLQDFNHHTDEDLPDSYTLPPVEVQSFDDWKDSDLGEDKYYSPDPDYDVSDDDEEEDIGDLVQKQPTSNILSLEEWDQICASAEDLPPPPPEADFDLPEPDYEDDSPRLAQAHPNNGNHHNEPMLITPKYESNNEKPQGLIEPKKLANPCKESKDRQNLHREMMYNKKFGIDPLHKSTELQKELRRRKEEQKRKEMEAHKKSKRTEFEEKLIEQADKLKLHENQPKTRTQSTKETQQSEFERIHSKISKTKSAPPTDVKDAAR